MSDLLGRLRDIVGLDHVLEGHDTAPYCVDWRKQYRGRALAVVAPDSTEQVWQIVRLCGALGVSIVPQGGNTGLVGGATPDASGTQVVLSLKRMNRILAIDPDNDTITVQAGCVLANVQHAARSAGRLFPLSLAAEGNCTVGGNLATNAGGTAVLRYGNARDLSLGLQVVTADGEVWEGLRGLRKDNAGYDLRDLFIGSEGTLGIITAAVFKLFPLPAGTATALVGVSDLGAAISLLQHVRRQTGPLLTAFEVISASCMALLARQSVDTVKQIAQPWASYYVLLECEDYESFEHATERLQTVLTAARALGMTDAVYVASNLAQAAQFWRLRESIPTAQAQEGHNLKHDISVATSDIACFVATLENTISALGQNFQTYLFGHLGDGNLHFNVAAQVADQQEAVLARRDEVNTAVFDIVARYQGSICAEHGVGQLRRETVAHYRSGTEHTLNRHLKQALDPQGILNPGKVLAVMG